MKPAMIIATLLAILAAAIVGVYWVWTGIRGSAMSIHGMIALGLGVSVAIALGAGLMFLVFYSSRRGYDDIEPPPTGRSDPDP